MIMDRLYGGVCYAGIDTDPELKYPKVSTYQAFYVLIIQYNAFMLLVGYLFYLFKYV